MGIDIKKNQCILGIFVIVYYIVTDSMFQTKREFEWLFFNAFKGINRCDDNVKMNQLVHCIVFIDGKILYT